MEIAFYVCFHQISATIKSEHDLFTPRNDVLWMLPPQLSMLFCKPCAYDRSLTVIDLDEFIDIFNMQDLL